MSGQPRDVVVESLRKVALVPDDWRSFEVSARRAAVEYRLPASVLAHPALPHRWRDGEQFFDHFDLHNVALDMMVRSPWTLGVRWWAQGLDVPGPARHCRVRYSFVCPTPGHDGPCRVEVLTPESGWVQRSVWTKAPSTALDIVTNFSLPTAWPRLPPPVADLLEEYSRTVQMRSLPFGLGADPGFIQRTGLADCIGAAKGLVAVARRRDLPVRLAMGLAVLPPYSIPHFWAEFAVADQWVPVDPVTVTALVEWGLLDREQWSPSRPTGAVLGRLGAEVSPIGRHDGDWLQLSMPTTYHAT